MRKTAATISLMLLAGFAFAGPVQAKKDAAGGKETAGGRDGTRGDVSIEGLTLSGTQFGTPTGFPTLVPTDALEVPLTEGASFRYSSIQCSSGPAPWNNAGLDFNPNFPGLTEPAPIRSVLTGTVTQLKTNPSGPRGKIEGTITSYLCVNGVETDQITVSYRARFAPTSGTTLTLRGGPVPSTGGLTLDGRFKITETTGRFADMTGHGPLNVELTCIPTTLARHNATSCAALGAFSEAFFDAEGSFKDPTT